MEGKNCFRTIWSQRPIFSGGSITSLAVPTQPFASVKAEKSSDDSAAEEAVPRCEECLVMACGDTVNVVRADSGDVLCSYTLPVEDVILHVDAVSVLAPRTIKAEKSEADKKEKTKKKAASSETKAADADEDAAAAAAADMDVPRGNYIAVGTRALQIYLLGVVVEAASSSADLAAADEEGNATETPATADVSVSYTIKPIQTWTAAQQAISVVCFSEGGQYLISGSTDGGVKVWNAFHHHLTHNLRCPGFSLIQSVYLDPSESFLVTGSFEGHVTVFDFVDKSMVSHGRPHVQAVEALALSDDSTHVFSLARDRRLSIQEMTKDSRDLKEKRAVVVKEHVSAALFENPSTLHVGSMDGVVVTYRVSTTEQIQTVCRSVKPPASDAEDNTEETLVRCIIVGKQPKGASMTRAGFVMDANKRVTTSPLYVADAGFNISLMSQKSPGSLEYQTESTLVGFLDQVLDIKQFPDDSPYQRLIVNNSKDVRLYTTSGCVSSHLLQGHSDIVMTCAVSVDGKLIATGGKDKEVRFWSSETCQTLAKGVRGHTAEITSMCFNAKQTDSYFLLFTISADENLRMWDVGHNVLPLLQQKSKANNNRKVVEFEQRAGINAAHAGPVYTIAVAPNDQYVATGGKDKMVNLWNITGKKVYKDATLKGHRRGISALSFSSADRVLASSSNDGSVRLWSLVSLTCVKTLQADKVPVLQLAFFNGGTQVVTGNAEGVLRVWAVSAAEAVWSSELHDEKVWALTVVEKGDSTMFLSGAADGVISATEDYTAEEVERLRDDRRDIVLKEQALGNAIARGEFKQAFMLALQLNHPRHLRHVLTQWCAKNVAQCEDTLRTELIPQLKEKQLERLLQFTREWITNSRHCMVASVVVFGLLGSNHFQNLAKLPCMAGIVEPLLAYSQKHSQRQHDLLRRTYYIDYVIRSLAPNALTTMPPFVSANGKKLLEDGDGVEVVEDVGQPPRQRTRTH